MITATFKNGLTITRNSKKNFGFAWYSKNIYQSDTGFASTKEKAKKAARSAFNGVPPAIYVEIVETTTSA
jgi:hypothetical protein